MAFRFKNIGFVENYKPFVQQPHVVYHTTGGHGRPRETTGDHRGQFPRTYLGPPTEPYFSTNAASPPYIYACVGEAM